MTKKGSSEMKTRDVIAIVLVVLTLAGCSGLKYKPYGKGMPYQVGFQDFLIKEGVYKVSYTGPTNSSQQLAMKFMYKRARELCRQKGFKSFEVSSENAMSKDNGSTHLGYGAVVSNNQPVSSVTITCTGDA